MMKSLTEKLHRENTDFNEGAVSEKYAPISTEIMLAPFLNKGWDIYTHKKSGGYGKEMLELRHPEYRYTNGDFLSLWVTNSFNGTCAFSFYAGYGRKVCDNGLVIGDIVGGKFIHSGTRIYERLENAYDKIVAHLEKLMEGVDRLKQTEITAVQVDEAITDIAKGTFEKDGKKHKVEVVAIKNVHLLLTPWREEDRANDAFTVLNRVQENIIRKGLLKVKVRETNKETNEVTERWTTKLPMEGNISSLAMNKRIAQAFLKVVA